MTRAGVTLGVVAVAALVAVAVGMRRTPPRPAVVATGPVWDSLPRDVDVEILNGTRTSGTARAAVNLLRHGGLDVVSIGDADSSWRNRERTVIVVRRRDTTGVGRIQDVLGGADVVDRYDASRMVDLSVIVGREFATRRRN